MISCRAAVTLVLQITRRLQLPSKRKQRKKSARMQLCSGSMESRRRRQKFLIPRECIPNFQKVKEKIEKSNSRRDDINSYYTAASQRVLSYENPWEPLFTPNKHSFSEEADTFLVICVGTNSSLHSFHTHYHKLNK